MGSSPIRNSNTAATSKLKPPKPQPAPITVPTRSPAKTSWAAPAASAPRQTADSFGSAAPAPAKPAVTPEMKEALTTSWRDWAVTGRDVAQVHRALEGMTMPEYAKAIDEMNTSGLLEKYAGAMDMSERHAFLDQARRKGVLGRLPDEKEKGLFEPPAQPGLYIQSPTLPKALQEAVHEGNLELTTGYEKEFKGYIARYADAVGKAESPEAIRELGEPVSYKQPQEPGLEPSHPKFTQYNGDWASKAGWRPSNKEGWDAISHRMDDLTGEVRPGSYWVQVEFEVVKKDGAITRGTGVDISMRDYGRTDIGLKKSLGGELDAGPVKGSVKAEVKGGVALQRGVHPHTEKEAELKGGVELGGHGPCVSLEVSSNGTTELGINLDEHLGSYAKGNAEEGTLEGGVKGKLELSKNYELEGKLGLGMKGITKKQVSNALDSESRGFFREPAERENRVPWSKLTEAKRDLYESYGYDEKNWKNW